MQANDSEAMDKAVSVAVEPHSQTVKLVRKAIAISELIAFTKTGLSFESTAKHWVIKTQLLAKIRQNEKEPIQHRVILDMDGMMIQLLDSADSSTIVIQSEYIKTHYPSCTLIQTLESDYYLLYPHFDLLILTILSWKGWSVDFFSAGGLTRNVLFLLEFLNDTFNCSLADTRKCFQRFDDDGLFNPNQVLEELRRSGRLRMLHSYNIPSEKFSTIALRSYLSSRSDVTPSAIIDKSDEEVLELTKDSFKKKDLRALKQTKEEIANGFGATDHMILVDDYHHYAHSSQLPYVLINSFPVPAFHHVAEELEWIGQKANELQPSKTVANTSNDRGNQDQVLEKQTVESYKQTWRRSDKVDETYSLIDALHLHYHTQKFELAAQENTTIEDNENEVWPLPYTNSPLFTSMYVLGILLQCKNLIEASEERLPLRAALHEVLKCNPDLEYPLVPEVREKCKSQIYYANNYYAFDARKEQPNNTLFTEFYERCIQQGKDYLQEPV
jgi:hypothetical protein